MIIYAEEQQPGEQERRVLILDCTHQSRIKSLRGKSILRAFVCNRPTDSRKFCLVFYFLISEVVHSLYCSVGVVKGIGGPADGIVWIRDRKAILRLGETNV